MKIKNIIRLVCTVTALFLIHACDDVPAPYNIDTDASVYGDGTLENPYTTTGAMLNQSAQYAWVKAYIVGYIPTSDDGSYTISDVVYSTEGAATTNLVISSSYTQQDINDCMAVQLPSGDIRTALNLSDNPTNLNKEVYLYGTLERYFGGEGIKNVTCAILDGEVIGEMPADESADVIFSETFASSLGDFTIYNVNIDASLGSEVWTYNSSYSCAYATAYSNYNNYAAESWLISPAIDLTDVSAATLTFDHVGRYFSSITSDITLWIANATADDTDATAWTQLTIPNYPDGESWTFVESGDIDLSTYIGQSVKIAFKYVSTSTKAGSYELKNFLVEQRQTEQSTTEEENQEEQDTISNAYTVAQAIAAYDASNAQADVWVKGYIVGYVTANTAVFDSEGAVTTNLMIADSADETDYTNCLIIQLPSGTVRTAFNLSDNPGNLGAFVTLLGSLEKYFGTAGLKSVTDYTIEGASDNSNDNQQDGQAGTTFTKAYSISDGIYLIAANVSNQYKVAENLSSSYTYGYLYTTDITSTASTISFDDPDELTFTFTSTSDGYYTITDSYGRYLYMSGSYNSFNVSSTQPSSGYLWDVTIDSDGYATITNTTAQKYIQYSTTYSSYGCYSYSNGTLPYLFKQD